jgi:hypothetical protein
MVLAKNSLFVFSSLQAHLRLEVFPYVKYTLSITERRTRGPCPDQSITVPIAIPSFISSVPNPFPKSK